MEDKQHKIEMLKKDYLEEFKRENRPDKFGFSKRAEESAQVVLEVLKKEALTYDDAYATLQYAYKLLKFESNFLRLE